MPETPLTRMRLSADHLALIDALAASNGGNRTQAVREAVELTHQAVRLAGEQNAEELSAEDWTRLGHLNNPDPLAGLDLDDGPARVGDWSQRLAHELVGMWEGRAVVLPLHREEADACRVLARRIAAWGPVRGYALFAALRHFWGPGLDDAPAEWWRPEVWLTPAR